MNKVFLVGNLTRDPELRQTNSGLASCQFTIAVNRPKNKDGVVQADYFTVQTWRAQAENCAKYLAKGRKVAVCGELRTRNYEKDGRKVYVTEVLANDVEFLTPRSQPSEPTEDMLLTRAPPRPLISRMRTVLYRWMTTSCRSKAASPI